MVIEDCNSALALDAVNIKAHYLIGCAFEAQKSFDDAVKHLQRALDLCKERTVSYKDDILRALLAARKRQWEGQHVDAGEHVSHSRELVARLLREHYEGEAKKLQLDAAESETLQREGAKYMDEAHHCLERLHVPHRPPEEFTCQISMDIMLDPVVTPCGVSYGARATPS